MKEVSGVKSITCSDQPIPFESGCSDVNTGKIPALPPIERPYNYVITAVHNMQAAPAGKCFIVVRAYSKEPRKQKGKYKRDRYSAHVLCDRADVDTQEKQTVIAEHIFKQLKAKYNLHE